MLRRTSAFVSIAFALSLYAATVAATTAQRTFVASTGNDANPCSIAAPCRNFARAIMQTSTGGEVIVLDSAGYGAVTITQSITINAPTGIYAGISVFSGDGITINAGATDTVVLRGLTINGQGGANGITLTNALRVHVENCVIAKMGDKGIYQVAGTLEVKDTIVRDGVWGIFVNAVAQANLDHVRIEGNVTGIAAKNGADIAMQDSVVTGNSNIGVLACRCGASASMAVAISRSLISSNIYGIYADGDVGGAYLTVIISDSTIAENSYGIQGTCLGTGLCDVFATRNTIGQNVLGLGLENTSSATIDGNVFARNRSNDIATDGSSFLFTRSNNTIGAVSVLGLYLPLPAY